MIYEVSALPGGLLTDLGLQHRARWNVHRHESPLDRSVCSNAAGSAACKGETKRVGFGKHEAETGPGGGKPEARAVRLERRLATVLTAMTDGRKSFALKVSYHEQPTTFSAPAAPHMTSDPQGYPAVAITQQCHSFLLVNVSLGCLGSMRTYSRRLGLYYRSRYFRVRRQQI